MIDDLRSQLKALEKWGEVLRIPREVDPRFELSAISKKLEAAQALFFEKIKGNGMPAVVGVDNSRSRIARVLGTDDSGLINRYLSAIRDPLPPLKVQEGPVKEIKILDSIDLHKQIPMIHHYEKDGGPFITAGVVIAEDPKQGIRNISYHRLQVLAKDEIGLYIQPRHLWNLLRQKEKEGKPLEVAIAIGLDAAIRLCGATWGFSIPFGLDELSIAGALRQTPVEIVACETVKVMVPAKAEIIIEGEILPGVRKPQGPLTDFTGTYGDGWDGPILKVKAITHRKDAIYQDLLPCTPEHHLLLAVPSEPVVYQAIQNLIPGLKGVHITPSSSGRFHLVIGIKKEQEGDGKNAIMAGLSCNKDIKLVVVVDDDIDLYNPREVERAVATRFQADRDVVIISGEKGNTLDPSCLQPGVTAKMGIDSTKPLDRKDRFELAKIPGFEVLNIQDYLTR